jgi:hypothetical protein
VQIDENSRTLETDTQDIVRFICEYILDNKIDPRTIGSNTVYNIEVHLFKKLFQASPFARYRNTDIRRKLRDMNYTVCSPERYDNTIKTGDGETVKVISICAEEVAEFMDAVTEIPEVTEY